MKATLLTPLSLVLLSLSASAVTLDSAAGDTAARDAAANVGTSGDVDQRLAALERRQLAAQHELADLAHESELLHARTLARGRAYTRLARAGLLPAGGGFQAFVEHAAKLERLHRALGRDMAEERRVAARRTALTKELSSLDQRRAPLLAEQRVLADAQTALLAARDRDAAFTRAFMGGALDDHTAVYGAPETTAVRAASGFASLKGSLPFPISGRSEIRSDHRRGSGPGLAMRAPAGTVVRSVFPGRVAFADTYADYGRTVILDHGGGYYTVSANLGEIEVKVGEEVKGGARIATLGAGPGDPRDSRGSSAGSALYFEVRIGQETADPAEWFGI